MELTTTQSNVFLNEWLQQIPTKVQHIPDEVLVDALKYIEEQGIPDLKNEAYRAVPIESILKRYFKKIEIASKNEVANTQVIFKNFIVVGDAYSALSIEKGIRVFTSADNIPQEYLNWIGHFKLHQKDFFAALNTGYCDKLIIIHITETLNQPLHLIHFISNQGNFNQQRVLVIVDEQVKATVLESYHFTCQQSYFYNTLSEVIQKEHSQLHWINVQNNPTNAIYSINNVSFSLEKSAILKHHQISLKGSLWRNNIEVHIQQPDVNAEMKGLSIGKNQSIISQYTSILHHSGHSHSYQLYKNIADDKSTVLFNGFILVDKNAQKTDAYQNSKNILLNDNATLFARPQLEIYADDVKCSHGSTTGSLNEDALFYLKARGIEEQDAQRLLLQAFFNDIIEEIDNADIREFIIQQIEL